MKFNEVQKYLTITRHQYNPQIIIVSKKVWDKLSPGRAEDPAGRGDRSDRVRAQGLAREERAGARHPQEERMQITELAPAEIEKMRVKVKPVVDKHSKVVGEDLVKESQRRDREGAGEEVTLRGMTGTGRAPSRAARTKDSAMIKLLVRRCSAPRSALCAAVVDAGARARRRSSW